MNVTNLEMPTNSKQKYKLTNEGRKLLAELEGDDV